MLKFKKKNRTVFTSKFVGTGPSSYKEFTGPLFQMTRGTAFRLLPLGENKGPAASHARLALVSVRSEFRQQH
jgi:hypothetical protein